MNTKRCVSVVLSFTVAGMALAADLGAKPKFLNSKVFFTLKPGSMSYPFYDAGVMEAAPVKKTKDAKPAKPTTLRIFVVNEPITGKLLDLTSQLESYGWDNKCGFASLSLGSFAATGNIHTGKDPGGIYQSVILADINEATQLAAQISLPSDWKARCKKELSPI